MFDEKTLEQCRKLMEQYKKTIDERYQGKDYATTTGSSKIPIKAVYTPLDVQDLDYEKDVGVQGWMFMVNMGTHRPRIADC